MQWRLIAPGLILVVGCGVPTTAGYIHVAEQHQTAHAADMRTDEHLQLARELPANPPDVAVALVEFIGEGGQNADALACLMFSASAADQLAATVGVTSCSTAIEALHDDVSDQSTYINSAIVPPGTWSSSGNAAVVNGCAINWDGLLADEPPSTPGPLPGSLTLTRQDDKGWLITAYRPC
jgi:hypothetical protein